MLHINVIQHIKEHLQAGKKVCVKWELHCRPCRTVLWRNTLALYRERLGLASAWHWLSCQDDEWELLCWAQGKEGEWGWRDGEGGEKREREKCKMRRPAYHTLIRTYRPTLSGRHCQCHSLSTTSFRQSSTLFIWQLIRFPSKPPQASFTIMDISAVIRGVQ